MVPVSVEVSVTVYTFTERRLSSGETLGVGIRMDNTLIYTHLNVAADYEYPPILMLTALPYGSVPPSHMTKHTATQQGKKRKLPGTEEGIQRGNKKPKRLTWLPHFNSVEYS